MESLVTDRKIKILNYIELFGLYCLAFALPTMESPKHIAFGIFFIGAIGKIIASGPIKFRKPDKFELILIIMWAATLISTIVNWDIMLTKGTRGIRDISAYLAIVWFIYQNQYKQDQIKKLLIVLVCGILFGIGWALLEIGNGDFEFNSVEGVSRSSIYLAISIIMMFGIIIDSVSGFTRKYKNFVVFAALVSLPCLFVMGSRGAVLGFIITLLILIVMFFYNRKFRMVLGIGTLFTIIVVSGTLSCVEIPKLTNRIKHLQNIKICFNSSVFDSLAWYDQYRFEYWKIGYAQITQGRRLLFGIGPFNFSSVDIDKLIFKKPLVYFDKLHNPCHAHNIFLTKLAEEGILGLSAFIIFISYILLQLIKFRPSNGNNHWTWASCAGVLIISIVAGSFNSAFYHEMAWFSMIIIGLGMNRVKQIKHNQVFV